jgi:bifunctional DNA-binding transcriptional regulator/antitoxin component of YhaV-PrlF toxin-antitoxin module
MPISLQVQQRGTLALPADLCKKHGIKPGDILHLIDLDGIFVLTPTVPMVPELAREIERMRREAGLSIKELLTSLREQREQVHLEHYGDRETP